MRVCGLHMVVQRGAPSYTASGQPVSHPRDHVKAVQP